MSSSRIALVNLLENKFNRDRKLYENVLQKSRAYWAKGDAGDNLGSRAFDILQFVSLVTPHYFKFWLDDFMALLSEIYSIYKTEEGYFLANKKDQDRVKAWAMNIVEYGCENFLEKDGRPNQKLLRLLEWDKYAADFIQTPIQIRSLISSLIGIIFQQFAFNKTTQRFIVMDVHMAIVAYINKNYGNWINAEIEKTMRLTLDDSVKVEVKAAHVLKKLLSEEVDFPKLEKTYDELALTDHMNKSSQRSFWLELMMQSIAHETLFAGMWRVFSHRINPARDVPYFNDHQKYQYDFCKKRFAKIQETPSASTVRMLDRLYLPVENKPVEMKSEVRLPLAMPVVLTPKHTTEEEKEDVIEDDYFFVPENTPHYHVVWPQPSLFTQITQMAQGAGEQAVNLVEAIKMRWR